MLATIVDTLRDLDDPTLTAEFRRLELERRRIEAEMAAVVAEGQRRSIHVVDHHHSMTGWLKANANYSGTRTCVRRWEALADLDGAHADREANVENRRATVVDLDGALDLRASGGHALATAEMIAIFDAEVEHRCRATSDGS